MNIAQFSTLSQLSPYTLRYYEKLGLLKVARHTNGHRYYTSADIEWVRFISRLKATGMPLKQILLYARLRAIGATTLEQRQELLQNHHSILEKRIQQELEHLQALKNKIDHYQHLINA